MAEAFQFDLVSPERLLMSQSVSQVVVPGSEGYMTVLADHAPVMTTLKPGLLEVTDEGGSVQEIFIRGGFADISPAALTVLADMAVPMEDLTADMLEEEMRLAQNELTEAAEDFAKHSAAQKKLDDLESFKRWKIPA
ncbi:MAG TPA: F0F1 ATP synthase subunit epsilon [Afifellaceae bacterium]|nr:F0F1 ATP synthase subunit epsilon [Afifellaceae bacterium]